MLAGTFRPSRSSEPPAEFFYSAQLRRFLCPQALTLAVFLEDSARVELAALHAGCGDQPGLTPEQCAARAVWAGQVAERQWQYWTERDPESAPPSG